MPRRPDSKLQGPFAADPGKNAGPAVMFFSASANNRVTAHVAAAADAT